MNITVHSDALQAGYFLAELERLADLLVAQIDDLDKLSDAGVRANRQRNELYEVRRQIEALHARFGGAI